LRQNQSQIEILLCGLFFAAGLLMSVCASTICQLTRQWRKLQWF